jgi:porphobilinogen synthase
MSYTPAPKNHLHSAFGKPLLKAWNVENQVTADNILYPVFVVDQDNVKEEITSLPGQYRWSVDRLDELIKPLVEIGLRSVILFGVITDNSKKDATATFASAPSSPVIKALQYLRTAYPDLLLVCDVCLCGYSDHGHCGILTPANTIDNQPSIEALARMSVAFADAGCSVIAPSDMMDGRIGAIKAALHAAGHGSTVAVMSYAAKFASCFYGPFRDAAASGCKFGDRSNYQLPAGSRGLAVRAMERDLDEGADFLMVKPGMPYLDIVRDCSNIAEKKGIPVAVYQVSGEYAMLWHAHVAGAIKLEEAVMESMLAFRRAGATVILTYYAEVVLRALRK